jgi:hypothetical protein
MSENKEEKAKRKFKNGEEQTPQMASYTGADSPAC